MQGSICGRPVSAFCLDAAVLEDAASADSACCHISHVLDRAVLVRPLLEMDAHLLHIILCARWQNPRMHSLIISMRDVDYHYPAIVCASNSRVVNLLAECLLMEQ